MKIHQLLQSESNWFKGEGAINKDGVLCTYADDKTAVAWDLLSAFALCYPPPFYSGRDAVIRFKESAQKLGMGLDFDSIHWVNELERSITHAQLIAALKEADV